MKKSEIQQNLHTLSQNIDQENFIYDFLASFGLSKTTITRLKKGDYNLSKVDGELFCKGKIFFKVEKEVLKEQFAQLLDDYIHKREEIGWTSSNLKKEKLIAFIRQSIKNL